MFKKARILFVAMLMFISNIAFSAMSVYSFVSETSFVNNKEDKIDIVKQYRGIVNMPKMFCDICVKLTEEIVQRTDKNKKGSNINTESDYNDIVGCIEAVENNNNKQKFVGFNNKKFNLFVADNESRFLYTARERFIFYIIQYIGLLRANDLINNIILTKNIYSGTLFVV